MHHCNQETTPTTTSEDLIPRNLTGGLQIHRLISAGVQGNGSRSGDGESGATVLIKVVARAGVGPISGIIYRE